MVQVAAFFLVGIVLRVLRIAPAGTAQLIDRAVIHVALPALVLRRVTEMEVGWSAMLPGAVAWLVLLALAAAVLAAARVAGWSRSTTGALLLVIPLGNTSFLGIPAVTALLGADHVASAVVYDQAGTFLGLVTYGSWVAARWGTASTAPRARQLAGQVVRFPPFVSLVVAIALNPIGLPQGAAAVLDPLAWLVGPLALIGIGLRTRLPRAEPALPPVAVGLLLRLVAAPAGALLLMRGIGADGVVWDTSVLQAGMPPMVTAGIVAVAAGLDERTVTLAVSGGLVASLVTLPLLAALLGS